MKKLTATAAVLALSAPIAAASSSHYVKVSPSTVKQGDTVRVYGAAGGGCSTGSTVTLYSRAFVNSTKHSFAGVPSVSAKVDKHGKFSKKVAIQNDTPAKTYHVGARCGGGNLGSVKLTVKPGFY